MKRWMILGGLALATIGCSDRDLMTPDPAEAPSASTSVVAPSGNAVVVFKSETGVPSAGLDLITTLGGTITSRYDGIGVVFASGLSSAALSTLRGNDLVEDAGPDYELNWIPDDLVVGDAFTAEGEVEPDTHDPTRASQFKKWQWGPQRIAADQAWAVGYVGNSSIRVAILDTGIDVLHDELRGLMDLNASKSFVPTEPSFDDQHFHGTHVASTVTTNSVAIAGIAPHVTLIAVKVLSALGSGTFEGVIGGILHAGEAGAHVINMSLGAVFDKKLDGAKALIRAMQRAVQHVQKQGTLVVSAAGNDAINFDEAGTLVSMPCMVSHLCVSATGPLNGQFDANGPILTENHDRPAYYTNYGFRAIHVAAPGGNANPADRDRSQGTWRTEDLIAGACAARALTRPQCAANDVRGTVYIFAGGTSMATPHVSGAAALIQAQNGGALTPDQLIERLTRYADDIGASGPDVYSNYGRINVLRAIRQQ